jgi:protease II
LKGVADKHHCADLHPRYGHSFTNPETFMPAPKPPIAQQIPHTSRHHDVTLSDPYHWLRDPGYPEVTQKPVLDYLKAENRYFKAQMKPYATLVETLFQEMKGRIKEDDASIPQKDGDYLYWRRFEKGAQYRSRVAPMKCCWMKSSWPRASPISGWAA